MSETLSREPEQRCIYSIEEDTIKINPIWIDYLIVHRNILEGFARYRLNCFLARRNPNFMLPFNRTLGQSINEMAYNGFYAHETSAFYQS